MKKWKIFRCIGCQRRLRKAEKRRIVHYENGLVCQDCDIKETKRRFERMMKPSKLEKEMRGKRQAFFEWHGLSIDP